jgi:hypothetical protein
MRGKTLVCGEILFFGHLQTFRIIHTLIAAFETIANDLSSRNSFSAFTELKLFHPAADNGSAICIWRSARSEDEMESFIVQLLLHRIIRSRINRKFLPQFAQLTLTT